MMRDAFTKKMENYYRRFLALPFIVIVLNTITFYPQETPPPFPLKIMECTYIIAQRRHLKCELQYARCKKMNSLLN